MNTFKGKRLLLVAFFILASLNATNANAGLADDLINGVQTTVNTVSTRLTNYGDFITKRIVNVDDGVNKFSPDFRNAVDEAIAAGQLALTQEIQGANAFLNSGQCESFRAEFVGLIGGVNQIGNRLADINGLQANMSMQTQINLLNSFPCKALYPLYRATSETIDIGNSGVLEIINKTLDGLNTIKELAAYEVNERIYQVDNLLNDNLLSNHLGEKLCKSNDPKVCRQINSCRFHINNDVLVGQATSFASHGATALSALGWALRSGGEIGLDKLDGMIWGWVGTDIKFNIPKTLGKGLVGAANILSKASVKNKAKLHHCIDVYATDRTLAQLNNVSPGGFDLTSKIDNLIDGQAALSNDHSEIITNQQTMINEHNLVATNQQRLIDGQQTIRENQQACKGEVLAGQENLALAIAKIQEDQQVILQNIDDIESHPGKGRETRQRHKSWWKW